MAEESIFQKIAKAVGSYAPGIAAILAATGVGAPVAAAVAAVGALAKSFGLPEDSSAEIVATKIMNTADMTEIRLKFVQAENDFQLKQRDQELEIYRVQLADIQSARTAKTEGEKATGKRDTNLYALAWTVITCFFILMGILLFAKLEPAQNGVIFMLFGSLAAGFSQVLSFFFGSSKGSENKTDMIYNSTPNMPKKEV
jgi:hypothetical protein